MDERDDAGKKAYRPGPVELPHRAYAVLTNVARGHALINGRDHITIDDIVMVVAVTVSSIPGDANSIFRVLVEQGGELKVEQVQGVLKAKTRETARDRMEYAHALGVMRFEERGPGKAASLSFAEDWAWCASPEFRALLFPASEPVKNRGVCLTPAPRDLVERPREKRDEKEEVDIWHPP